MSDAEFLALGWVVFPDQEIFELALADPSGFAKRFFAAKFTNSDGTRAAYVDSRYRDVAELCASGLNVQQIISGTNALSSEFCAAFHCQQDRQLAPMGSRVGFCDPRSDAFLESREWKRLRMTILERDGAKCLCCGRTRAHGAVMNVDHIKPRKKYPQLALDPANLQVLCDDCNLGKGNRFSTDWRARAHRV